MRAFKTFAIQTTLKQDFNAEMSTIFVFGAEEERQSHAREDLLRVYQHLMNASVGNLGITLGVSLQCFTNTNYN